MGLSRADWTEAGLSALGDGGLRAVAVEPLARSLKTTKGSFYWHFMDRSDLLGSVMDLWEDRETTQIVAALDAISDARTRLTALGRGAYARASRGGAHAALLTAADDPQIATVLSRVTETRLKVLERLFRDLGLDHVRAYRHARLAYSVYLGTAALRRADTQDEPSDAELEQRVTLFVESVIPESPQRG